MTAKLFQPDDAVTSRMTAWVRRHTAKSLAAMTGAEVATAVGWRAGNWPAGPAFRTMVALWGEGFLAYVFAPMLTDSDLSLDRRLERMAADLAALREETHAHRLQDRRPSVGRGGAVLSSAGATLSAAREGADRR